MAVRCRWISLGQRQGFSNDLGELSLSMTLPTDLARFTIGWIVPLSLELTAAIPALNDDLENITVNERNYYEGKIGQHYIVMIVQPTMRTNAASALAIMMRIAFKSLRCFLVMRIEGRVSFYDSAGALHQMMLGDVMISTPVGRHGGVFQYDFGA